MTDSRDDFRLRGAEIAETLAEVLAANPLLGGTPYPAREVLTAVIDAQERLQVLVDEQAGPITLTPDGRIDPFGEAVAALISHLQLARVLYHGLDDIPEIMRVAAGRNLANVHMLARKVRDVGRGKAK